jgi:hypothetical protein
MLTIHTYEHTWIYTLHDYLRHIHTPPHPDIHTTHRERKKEPKSTTLTLIFSEFACTHRTAFGFDLVSLYNGSWTDYVLFFMFFFLCSMFYDLWLLAWIYLDWVLCTLRTQLLVYCGWWWFGYGYIRCMGE